jgi:hypothetical protein
VAEARQLDRHACRRWVEETYSREAFAGRIERWLREGLQADMGAPGAGE